MKIVMFGHKCVPCRDGGVEVVVTELSERLVERGHSVVCLNRAGKPGNYRGIRLKTVLTVHRKGLAAVTSSISAAVCGAFSDADVVHIHAEGPALMCWLPKLLGKRVIVTVHGLDWQRAKWQGGPGAKYIRAGERMAVRFADEIIVLSRNAQRYFRETYGRDTCWIPNGVTRPAYREPEGIRSQFGLEKDSYILFLGRLVPEKGIHYLIEAFQKVKTEKRLVIAGASSDTDGYVKRLKALASGDSRVLFTGFAEGTLREELFSNAWVYVLPSELEGMPLSLLEAMSCGNCCLVSDIPECAEVVEDRAVLFPKGNVDALRQGLQRLCEDPAEVEKYRASAADYICGKYNWEEIVDKTLELYDENFAGEQISAPQRRGGNLSLFAGQSPGGPGA